MVEITSREELEEWLKDKPADWALVIAIRAALRALPFAFGSSSLEKSSIDDPVIIFRAAIIVWAASNISSINGEKSATAAAHAIRANIADRRFRPTDEKMPSKALQTARAVDAASYALARAADTSAASSHHSDRSFSDFIARASFAAHAEVYAAGRAARAALSDEASRGSYFVSEAYDIDSPTRWLAVSDDCGWISDHRSVKNASVSLIQKQLWIGETTDTSVLSWQHVVAQLSLNNSTYQVWIDWYNRRIEGHDAAFDILGDTDLVYDKAILARLANATDEDFWGKGATYVNTTLQRWIDEAREQAAIDYVASGAPLKLGSAEELAARPELLARFAEVEAELAKLKGQLASLTGTEHGQIGHNQPPDEGNLRDEEIALLNQRVVDLEAIVPEIGAALAKLETVVPAATAGPTQAVEAVAELVVRVPELNLWQRAMQPLEDRASPEIRKGFENAAGAGLFSAIVSAPYIAYVTLPTAITAFLHHFYTVWFPILPG
jgi:hypothetical protein